MRGVLAAGVAVALIGHGHGKPASHASAPLPPVPRPVYVRPAAPLPMLPRVARVRVEAARDRAVVVEDVHLPRGDWESGGLDLYVAFGAPGTPIAIDAHLSALASGEPRSEEGGDVVALERASERNAGSQPLLGRPHMAGVVLHLKEAQLKKAYATAEIAILRVRSLLMPPAASAEGARDVVVRLGAPDGAPITLGRLQVVSLEPQPWITRAEATLCGPDASPLPLTVSLADKSTPTPTATAASRRTIAPDMAERHASDDLCIRWWAAP